MDNSISDILNGNEAEVETAEVETQEVTAELEATTEEVKAEGPARGPDGKFVAKGETEDAPPASNEYDGKATLAERRKRQEAEQRIAALEAQIQAIQNPPAPAPDMFDNPEGWQQHFGGQVTSTAVSQATLNSKLEMSEMLARDKFDDFDDMKAKFMELAEQNPAIAQQALSDPHPWKRAYQIAKNAATMQEVGATDLEGLRASIRAELEAEMKAKPPVEIPTSLATAQGGRAIAGVPTGPLSLQDILNS